AVDAEAEETSGSFQLAQERYAEMSAQEQVVLTVSVNGYGKRTLSYEYRTTGLGVHGGVFGRSFAGDGAAHLQVGRTLVRGSLDMAQDRQRDHLVAFA
ncbi:hypothetical protein, partial [Bradyrhizobium ottawaense]|uniref:hypothetical protein n=1 Tax=Bradyrhizobium ottawaense TaxID=931866 RepID=UPI0030C76F26